MNTTMTSRPSEASRPWTEIVTGFLKVGLTAYGGPAFMGVVQAEFQERRQWVSKPRFLEGVALVNVLPGATAVQLSIFLGYARAGWWGGLLAGLAFAAPGFCVMLGLTLGYAALGVNPIVRGALYGLPEHQYGDGRQQHGDRERIRDRGRGHPGECDHHHADHARDDALNDRLRPPKIPHPVERRENRQHEHLAPVTAVLAGAVIGVVRNRICDLSAVRAVLCVTPWGR